MGATNFTYYSDNQIQAAKSFKALGHPARIAIIELLTQYDSLTLSDLNHFIPLSQSNLSRHCKELFQNGLLLQTTIGNSSHYQLNMIAIVPIIQYLEHIEAKKGGSIPPTILHLFKNIHLKAHIRRYPLT